MPHHAYIVLCRRAKLGMDHIELRELSFGTSLSRHAVGIREPFKLYRSRTSPAESILGKMLENKVVARVIVSISVN